MPFRQLLLAFLLLSCCHCREIPRAPQKVSFAPLTGYRFYPPCGEPVLSGDLPGGYYFAFVLTDSMQIGDCIGKTGPVRGKAALPMQFGRDFLLVLEAGAPCSFHLQHMEVVDSILHIHLRADTLAGNGHRIWKINGEGVKLVRLMTADPLHYAYVPGPQWDHSTPQLRHAHWKE